MIILIILILILLPILLCLFALMPRMSGRPSFDALFDVPGCKGKGVPLYAHRGLHDNATDAPENSLAAFQKAVDHGLGMEMDVQITADNRLVVFHDETLERMARIVHPDGTREAATGNIHTWTFDDLKKLRLLDTDEPIPSFEEFLTLVDGKVPLIIEIKEERRDTSICPLVDAALTSYKGVYCIESFNPLAVEWYRTHRPDIVRGQLSEDYGRGEPGKYHGLLYRAMANLLLNFRTRPDFIAYNHKHSDMFSLNLCRRLFHPLMVAWTIKSEEELSANRERYDIFIFDSFMPDILK